ncbi:MAG TPA: hypothetical protein VMT30_03475 [Candidatus Saccharimonadia bacterium]|nr:hypothetical protein [Candidatus Saccharimonadia bacterium]
MDPALYDPVFFGASHVNLDRLGLVPAWAPDPRRTRLADRGVLLVGGILAGGPKLVLFERGIERLLDSVPPDRLACWGGINTHGGRGDEPLPPYLERFGLVGLRDNLPDSRYQWTADPSALHEALWLDYPVEHEVVVFNNWQPGCRTGVTGFPAMSNFFRFHTDAMRQRRIEAAIRFIASGETVLTSSYWGLMTAQRLGRKAILVFENGSPFSSKFLHLRRPAPICWPTSWRASLSQIEPYPDARTEDRDSAAAFLSRLQLFFGLAD